MLGMLATTRKNIKIKYLLDDEMHARHHMELGEWELLSQLHLSNNIQLSDLNMLGHCNFHNNHNSICTYVPIHMQETTVQFIDFNGSNHQIEHVDSSIPPYLDSLSPTQCTTIQHRFNRK